MSCDVCRRRAGSAFCREFELAFCSVECHSALHVADCEGANDVLRGAQFIADVWAWERDEGDLPTFPDGVFPEGVYAGW